MNLPRRRTNPWLHGWVVISLLSLAAPCWSQTTEPAKAPAEKSLTAEQRQRDLESFEVVWRTIRDKHWDPKLGGLNWQAVHDELRPKMEKATSSTQCREILDNMIDRLGQSHFAIVPEEAYHEIEQNSGNPSTEEKASPKGSKKANNSPTASKDANGSGTGRGVTGLEIRVVDGHALVVRVLDEFPAAKLGVRTGWEVVKIDGKDQAPVIQTIRETYKNSTTLDLHLSSAIMGRLRGKAGQKMMVAFHNGDGKETSLPIPLVQPAGVATRFGNLPLFFVHYESRKLPKNIVYFSLSAFFDLPRVMKALEETVKANLNADGFILDLRGNPGGIGAMAMGFGNWFVSARDQKLGTLFNAQHHPSFCPQPTCRNVCWTAGDPRRRLIRLDFRDLGRRPAGLETGQGVWLPHGRSCITVTVHSPTQRGWLSIRVRELYFDRW